MASPCACAVAGRSSASRCWASSGSLSTGANSSSPSSCAGASPSKRGRAASTISYAASADAARAAYVTFERTWAKRCPGVVTSLREGGDELLTFFSFPKAQWKTLRTTNTIERLHEEFRRRVKTQGSLPTEDEIGRAHV